MQQIHPISPGGDQEEGHPPWVGFRTMCNNYDNDDDNDNESFTSISNSYCQIRQNYNESSDEEDPMSMSNEDDNPARDEDKYLILM